MAKHTLKAGESLVSLAKANGFSHWKAIYDHPSNAALRGKRQHPNALLEGDELFVPAKTPKAVTGATAATHKFKVLIGRGIWNLRWSVAKCYCGTKVKLSGETNLPDGTVKLALKSRELESPKLPALTVKIAGGKLEHEWQVQDVQHLQAGSPPKAFAEVHLEVTTADAAIPCNVPALVVQAVPKAASQTFNANRSWSGFTNRSHFEQKIDGFINLVDVKPDVVKGWGGTYVNLTSAGITGTAGGCPWAGYRWARPSGLSMVPAEYHDGTGWVPLPAGFAPSATNYQAIGFYKSGDTFVSPSAPGGTWPEAFAEYDFNGTTYKNVRKRWSREAHTQWSNKFWIRRTGCKSDKSVTCCRYDVDVTLTFVEVAAHAANVVILAPGNLRSNAGLWFMGDTSNMPAHETGHHMDNPDEYAGGAVDTSLADDGAVAGIDADSIMGQNMTKTKKRHYHAFVEMNAKLVNGVNGRSDKYQAVNR